MIILKVCFEKQDEGFLSPHLGGFFQNNSAIKVVGEHRVNPKKLGASSSVC